MQDMFKLSEVEGLNFPKLNVMEDLISKMCNDISRRKMQLIKRICKEKWSLDIDETNAAELITLTRFEDCGDHDFYYYNFPNDSGVILNNRYHKDHFIIEFHTLTTHPEIIDGSCTIKSEIKYRPAINI